MPVLNAGQKTGAMKRLVWASRLTPAYAKQCLDGGTELWRAAPGFLGSAGYGDDADAPLSLVIDSRGIYYDGTTPSDLEVILNESEISPDLCQRAETLRQRWVKPEQPGHAAPGPETLQLPSDIKIILVPGQKESDVSTQAVEEVWRTDQKLLKAVREAEPEAFVIYRPYSKVSSGEPMSGPASSDYFDLEVYEVATSDLLERVDEVHTLTSLTGFEALMRGVPVTTRGLPFYAGWGLTQDRLNCPRRIRRRTLDELVAAALILYPVYVDPGSGHQVNVETALELLQRQRQKPPRLSLRGLVFHRARRRL
jgi:capsular polysaccharide export protein